MKPGDLVRGKAKSTLLMSTLGSRVVTGILIRRIETPTPANLWWEVLCDDGIVTEEIEEYMELVQ